MINQKDLRVRKTTRAIISALLALLETKPFSTISVIELTNRAEIGQTTFYNHYHDKYELAVALIRDTTAQLVTIFLSKFGLHLTVEATEVNEADYPKLLARAHLLMKIDVPEIDFHLITVNYMSKLFADTLLRYQLPGIDTSTVAAHLAAVAYSFIFQTHTNDPQPLTVQVEEFHQFYLVLTRLHSVTNRSSSQS